MGNQFWCFGFSISQATDVVGTILAQQIASGLQFSVNVTSLSISSFVVQSDVGEVDADVYDALTSLLVGPITSYLQTWFAKTSFTIPTSFDGVQLSNFSPLEYHQGNPGYICLYADMTYT